MASFGSLKSTIFEKEERKQQYQSHIRGLNAYDRHKKFIDDYGLMDNKELIKLVAADLNFNVVNPNIARFIRSEEDDMNPSWEQRLVKRYYDKLFKEYSKVYRRIQSVEGLNDATLSLWTFKIMV
ncbi:Protein FRA10AC1 [Glycine soja]|nr:Protein FRA10AC1 [Glycine max]